MKRTSKILSLLILLFGIVPIIYSDAAYDNTYANTGNQRSDIIGVAKTQVGYSEGSNNNNKYGSYFGANNVSWCAYFIVWCARQANIDSSVIKTTGWADADDLGVTYKARGSYTPQSGDIIIFDYSPYSTKTPASSYGDHVGLVEYVDGGYVHTIEGNSKDMVRRGTYSLSYSEIKGYGAPNYKSSPVNDKPNYSNLQANPTTIHQWQTVEFISNGDSPLHNVTHYTLKMSVNDERVFMKKVPHYYYHKFENAGTYRVYVSTVNDSGWCDSNVIYIKVTPHTWNSGKVTKTATCTATGTKTYTCTVSGCGATKTETIAKNSSNHTGGTEVKNVKTATCKEVGYTGNTYCKGCGAKLSSGSSTAKLSTHTWNSGKVTKTASCTSTGINIYTCTICGTTKTETIAKNSSNHTGGTEIRNAKTATCTSEGYTGDKVCNGCGKTIETGKKIAKLNHTIKTIPAVAPTCTTDGKSESIICSVCNTVIQPVASIPALGHSDNNSDGKCDDCGASTGSGSSQPSGKVCKYCGQIHAGLWGKIVGFVHAILALFGLHK